MPIRPPAHIPPNTDRPVPTLLYVVQGSTGLYTEVNFSDGSIVYFNTPVKQKYQYVLIDNIGLGDIRISLRQGLNLTAPIIGAKTLKSKDCLYIEDDIYYISIYFISSSIVEIIALTDQVTR